MLKFSCWKVGETPFPDRKVFLPTVLPTSLKRKKKKKNPNCIRLLVWSHLQELPKEDEATSSMEFLPDSFRLAALQHEVGVALAQNRRYRNITRLASSAPKPANAQHKRAGFDL